VVFFQKITTRPDLEILKIPDIDQYKYDPEFQNEKHRDLFELDAIYRVKENGNFFMLLFSYL